MDLTKIKYIHVEWENFAEIGCHKYMLKIVKPKHKVSCSSEIVGYHV